MLRKPFCLFVVLALFLAGCGKGSDNGGTGPTAFQFIINGIHDVTMDATGGNILPVAVALYTGIQEPVTLSVTGLPAGLTASITPATGTPDFGSVITFSGTTTPGTYPIKLAGTSASYYKEYGLSVIVPGNTFNINGTRDVTLGGSSNIDTLNLTVVHATGMKEPVTLSVTGLPAGVTTNIQPPSGTANFTSVITFIGSAGLTAGSYPIKIIGTAASYTKSYDVNLVVPAFNGYKFNGLEFHTKTLGWNAITGGRTMAAVVPYEQPGSGGHSVECVIFGSWPTADGTYTYQTATSLPTTNGIMQLAVSAYSTYFVADPGQTITVKVAGGKFGISGSSIATRYMSTPMTLDLDARQ
jgi:hypothetical protein